MLNLQVEKEMLMKENVEINSTLAEKEYVNITNFLNIVLLC